jgi:hypothetical protein
VTRSVVRYAIVHGSLLPQDVAEHILNGRRPFDSYMWKEDAENSARPFERVVRISIEVERA